MLGYYKNPEATAQVLIDGVFHTGDIGHVTSKNQVVINGRKKNLIVLDNGKNICPEEIENHLLTHVNGIREAVVFESIKMYGETESKIIAAAVYADPKDFPKEDPAQIEHKLKEALVRASFQLPAFMRIGDVEIFREEFPKTATMKIIRQEVIALYNQKKGEQENA